MKGGYVIRETEGSRDITLIATGTEVAVAIEAATKLAETSVQAAVVSLPCWSLFDAQPAEYRTHVLGTAPRLAVEAASSFGWTRYVAGEDDVIGVDHFGASARAEQLYADFGITPENISEHAKKRIAKRRPAKMEVLVHRHFSAPVD